MTVARDIDGGFHAALHSSALGVLFSLTRVFTLCRDGGEKLCSCFFQQYTVFSLFSVTLLCVCVCLRFAVLIACSNAGLCLWPDTVTGVSAVLPSSASAVFCSSFAPAYSTGHAHAMLCLFSITLCACLPVCAAPRVLLKNRIVPVAQYSEGGLLTVLYSTVVRRLSFQSLQRSALGLKYRNIKKKKMYQVLVFDHPPVRLCLSALLRPATCILLLLYCWGY